MYTCGWYVDVVAAYIISNVWGRGMPVTHLVIVDKIVVTCRRCGVAFNMICYALLSMNKLVFHIETCGCNGSECVDPSFFNPISYDCSLWASRGFFNEFQNVEF